MNRIITEFTGKGIAIRGNDIDTDRIIPARFMKCVTFEGLGRYAFNDERFDGRGESKGHSFDDSRWQGHSILAVNANFGCGSSREHAPQALKDYGIGALIGESFAEIFAGNCSSLGIPAVMMGAEDIGELQRLVEGEPEAEITIDIEKMRIRAVGESGEREWKANMSDAYRMALLDGSWDSTSVLARAFSEIDAVATRLPYVRSTSSG